MTKKLCPREADGNAVNAGCKELLARMSIFRFVEDQTLGDDIIAIWRAMYDACPPDDEIERLRAEVAALRECVKAADAMRAVSEPAYNECADPACDCHAIINYDTARRALG